MSQKRILECVPNFSEGRRKWVIDEIVKSIQSTGSVGVLHTDMGEAANRTVITFAGEPEAIIEAAFRAVKTAAEHIDMSQHHGVHPRMGATDVLPLIPVSGITMEETIQLSFKLAERIGKELEIPVYTYENSSKAEYRRKLESVRHGEYEGLPAKMSDPLWLPDFGNKFNPKSGTTILGARNFLVAYNVNLDTKSVEIAKKIASEVRDSGYYIHENGIKKHVPGILKSVKAIGWYIEDFNKVQVSMNLTNLEICSVFKAFETVKTIAHKYNVVVTGSELIGLIPLNEMIKAGICFSKNGKLSERELIHAAIFGLGLNEISNFESEDRILEYKLQTVLK